MKLGALSVPIPDGSLKVAGGVKYATQPDNSFIETFVAKQDGSNGVYSNPISVPGGALGIDTPLGLTQISATVESVGVPDLKVLEQELTMPVRLKLSNPLLGDDCYIGSVSNPINLHLTTTGNPPSEPIGEFPGAVFPAVPHSDAVFAAPGASGCGTAGCAQLGRESTRGSAGGQRKELSHHVERRLRGGCTKGATACLTDERGAGT